MKKNTKILAFGTAVILLIGGYYLAKAYKTAEYKKKSASYESIKLTELKVDGLVKIEIPTAELVLEKKGEDWTSPSAVNGIHLNQEEVKSVAWSLTHMSAERVVDEAPKDLSVYGLAEPVSRIILSFEDGTKAELLGGSKTPSKSSFYGMRSDDPKVYILSSYPGERLYTGLSDLRDKNLPGFKPEELQHIRIVTDKTLEIEIKTDPAALVSSFSNFIVTSPYKQPRGADGEVLNQIIGPLSGLKIQEFVDDKPASLAKYGLDKPAADVFVQAGTSSLHLLVGAPADRPNRVFAKLSNSPGVFTLEDIRQIVLVRPFDTIDKFALIIGIDRVNKMTAKIAGKTYAAEITREKKSVVEKDKDGKETTKEESVDTYFIDGKKVEEKLFKEFYQSCIGLIVDAEIPAGGAQRAQPEAVIEYTLNNPSGKKAGIELVPYNRDFYALYREGSAEFLVSKMQVEKIMAAIEKIKAP